MIQVMVSVFDQVAQVFSKPVFVGNEAIAMRSLRDEVNSGSSGELAKHPSDFALYRVGVFDDNTGIITCEERPALLCRADSLKEEV